MGLKEKFLSAGVRERESEDFSTHCSRKVPERRGQQLAHMTPKWEF